jgi:hypothetical protein
MTDKQIFFSHVIPVQVFSKTQKTNLKLFVNESLVYEKIFEPGIENEETIMFDRIYTNGTKNKISFFWSRQDQKEDSDKLLSIKDILIKKQPLNVHNAEYFPIIDQFWWSGLNDKERSYFNDIIYGKSGKKFGWFGEINFYFCSGVNFGSKHLYNIFYKDSRKLVSENIQWIYDDESCVKTYNRNIK